MSEDKNYIVPGSRAEIMGRIRILEQHVIDLEMAITDLKDENIKIENHQNGIGEKMKKSEEWDKLNNLKKALDDIEEIAVPCNIIDRCIFPLRDWLNDVLKTGDQNGK